jgi:hypothetical protein
MTRPSASAPGTRKTERNPGEHQGHSLEQHHRDDPAGRGAHRHSHTNFPRPLGDGIRQEAVEPTHREHHRKEGERAHENRAKAIWRQGLGNTLIDRSNIEDWLFGIDTPDGVAHGIDVRQRITSRPDHDV